MILKDLRNNDIEVFYKKSKFCILNIGFEKGKRNAKKKSSSQNVSVLF